MTVPGFTTPGHLTIIGTLKPPSQVVPFSPRNGVVPPSGQVNFSAPLSVLKITMVLDADEPPLLLGNDHGPNPVEYALTALAACVTTSIIYHAAARGVTIRSMESRLEGDIDLQGFLGIKDDVHRGYEEVRMYVNIDADARRTRRNHSVRADLFPGF